MKAALSLGLFELYQVLDGRFWQYDAAAHTLSIASPDGLEALTIAEKTIAEKGAVLLFTYSGARGSMLKTLETMRLPRSWPNRLGEKVFHLLYGYVEQATPGQITATVSASEGKEHQLEAVLQALHSIYASRVAQTAHSR